MQAHTDDMHTKELTKPTHVEWGLRPTQYFSNYDWIRSLSDRRRGVTYMGPNSRLRVKLHDWLTGAWGAGACWRAWWRTRQRAGPSSWP